jgi:hypothetical protein
MGRVILISQGKPLWQRELQRPNDGVVANSGHSAVNDWLFGSGLRGKFYVLSPAGDVLIEARVSANLVKCGITDDGELAWCSTARSDTKRDSEIVGVFTVNPPKQMFKTESLYGEVSHLSLSSGDVHIVTEHGIAYQFSTQGKLLNGDLVETSIDKVQIEKGSSWELLGIVESRLQKLSVMESGEKSRTEVFELLKLASERDSEGSMGARIERLRGKLNYALGDKEIALTNFKRALELDPKVGVKRLISKLEKEVAPKTSIQ